MILSLTPLHIEITVGGGRWERGFKNHGAWLISLNAGIIFSSLKISSDDSGVQPRFRIPGVKCVFPKLAGPEFLKFVEIQA